MAKSEKRKRTELLLGIRCLPEEKEAIQEKARTAGLSVGEFLRRCALERKISVRTDVRLMNELLRLGGLQKHLYNEMRLQMTPELSRQFADVLVEIRKAVVALDIGVIPSDRVSK
ncbi:TPA: plasmid mobilization protein MobA [Salmonella enterica subsp. enterica serovar Strathcona]|uniref:Ribbon-helix-helix protein, CopG family n=1 Tax=Salmonella enterica TaxID=28901 RepID=A0A757VYE6_SALER|nr:ribbon-helix-helix protein, CopG family [Salmonella enterica subsp. diarizonae]EGU4502698.1 ribbon-helix-helix protein, CopG family [Salmonella enterica]HAG0930142.1 ribbon-helix-helix protein, CopG family [Salmonella enterica]HCL5312669.1 ribbon-helix-helix protein, CopG family [Salmonella enterica]